MRTKKFYKAAFLVAALYDFILGFVFFVFYRNVYEMFNITLNDTPAYLQLSAAFVFAQGLLYYFVYHNLQRNIDIVKVGVAYKICYTGVAFFYWAAGSLPHSMFGVFGFCDVIFIILFVMYLADYKKVIANGV